MKPDQARGLFAECCGSAKWANGVTAKRPFRNRENVFKAADEVADGMDPKDWLDAFSHHPRIGETPEMKSGISVGVEWATAEQAGMEAAGNYAKIALMRANQEYERRFGYIYIVCATGKSADEMVEIAHERLGNDPETELRVAAGEQRKITRLRLEKLLEPEKKTGTGAKR